MKVFLACISNCKKAVERVLFWSDYFVQSNENNNMQLNCINSLHVFYTEHMYYLQKRDQFLNEKWVVLLFIPLYVLLGRAVFGQ